MHVSAYNARAFSKYGCLTLNDILHDLDPMYVSAYDARASETYPNTDL
jgi:hypothetical protein